MDKERIRTQFLIDREGKVHRYKGNEDKTSSLHDAIAKRLFPGVPLPGDYVHDLGWVTVGNKKHIVPVHSKELTQAQINTLDRLGLLETTKRLI